MAIAEPDLHKILDAEFQSRQVDSKEVRFKKWFDCFMNTHPNRVANTLALWLVTTRLIQVKKDNGEQNNDTR